MWMPTPLKKENSKFCSDEENEKKSEEDIGAIADAANKFKRTLDSLQEIKQAAVQDFREQYRANEAVEALGDDKNAKLQVKVNEERQRSREKRRKSMYKELYGPGYGSKAIIKAVTEIPKSKMRNVEKELDA